MTEPEQLAHAFEQHRSHLQRVAYAMLGSLTEAEDVVQETWLRLSRAEHPEEIRDLRAWLTTTVSRLALDAMSSARARREQYVGPWLPEPLVTRAEPVAGAQPQPDPADRVTLDESISLALLIVLERLSPAERTAFLLHDVFGFSFEQVAEVTGRSAAAARQLATRARRDVEAGRPRYPPTREQQVAITEAFAVACTEGDLGQLVALLDPDVVWRTDGGGRVNAARVIHHGADKVARGMLALAKRLPATAGYLADINGLPGLVLRAGDGQLSVIALTIDSDRIVAIDIVRNPDKLSGVPEP